MEIRQQLRPELNEAGMLGEKMRSHLLRAVFLRRSLVFASLWAGISGGILLALRAGAGITPGPLTAIPDIALLLLGVLFLGIRLSRQAPPARKLQALIEARFGLGGLLLTAQEGTLGPWTSHLRLPGRLEIRSELGRLLLLFMGSLLWVFLCFRVPIDAWTGNGRKLDLEREIHQSSAAVEQLEELNVLDQSEALALREALESIKAEADRGRSAEALASLDAVRATTRDRAEKAAVEAEKAMETMSGTQALAEALEADRNSLRQSRREDAARALADLVEKSPLPDQGQAAEALRQAIRSGMIPPEMLRQLADLSALERKRLMARLGRLEKMRLVKGKFRKGRGKPDTGALLALLEAEPDEDPEALVLALARGSAPGSGGIGKGPGEAPLTWGAEATREGVSFRAEALPPGAYQDLENTRLLGIRASAPEQETGHTGEYQPGRLSTGSGSAVRRRVLPRHRQIVKSYFEKEKE